MATEEEETPDVYTEGDTIFFFCDVKTKSVCELCVQLKKLTKTHKKIKICIMSSGGDLYEGYAGMDYIRTLVKEGIYIETIAYGFCASAAVDIFMAGSKRMMGRSSFILIHQMAVDIGGTYANLKADMKNNKQFMKRDRAICVEYTQIPSEVLDKLFTEDINLSAKKCLKYGIVHEII